MPHIQRFGGDAGNPIVLIHPLATSGAVWQRFGGWLARDGRPVLAPDLPDGDLAEVSIASMATSVIEAIEDAGRPADLIGMSMGGCVAQQVVLDRPDLIRRLVLADTTASYGPDRKAYWEQRAVSAETTARADLLDFQLDRWFTDAFRAENPAECQRIADIFVSVPAAVHAASARALGGFDAADRLGDIKTPTLVLVGEHDYATPPPMAEAIADGIPGATLVMLAGLKHFTLLESRDAWEIIAGNLAE
ncbi:MAG TPA: alpha/beta fold hydrolase [Micromonosporaceae bacterium]|jgi:3-oxoadipate enol-lactonase